MMGQSMSEPVTSKESSYLSNNQLKVGSSCMQGWRISMEDAHCTILSCSEDPDAAYFGVFDGHGGAKVAAFAANNLHKIITRRSEYVEGNMEEALIGGFIECDKIMENQETLKKQMSGSTAVVVLLKNREVWCANVGDSRCVAGVQGMAHPLSYDHKPMDLIERARIEAAGGFVHINRVNGNLALSRAMGDFLFKMNNHLPPCDQMVTSRPDVVHEVVGEDWDFIVLACDGIWDVMSNQEVTDFVMERLGKGMEPQVICEELMDRCLSPVRHYGGRGCDNMTVVLVCILHNKPFHMLVERCRKISRSKMEELRLKIREELENEV